tara:strand:+ start:2981 stop:3223 length:243 start_codon:yes stop_codon:yes gene_type:complete
MRTTGFDTIIELYGVYIQLFPGDTIPKWGEIVAHTDHNIIIKITKIGQLNGFSCEYEIGKSYCISWSKFSCSFLTNRGSI